MHKTSFSREGDWVIMSATELNVPPAGFEAPHRIAFVESRSGARRIAIVGGELPSSGDRGDIGTDAKGRSIWMPAGK